MAKENKDDRFKLGLLGTLQIIFIVLKLFNLIDWTWAQVFIPTFIWYGIVALIFMGAGMCAFIAWLIWLIKRS